MHITISLTLAVNPFANDAATHQAMPEVALVIAEAARLPAPTTRSLWRQLLWPWARGFDESQD